MADKFKDCFADQLAAFDYTVEVEGHKFECKGLSFRDKAIINGKSQIMIDGEMKIENTLWIFYAVLQSLIKWDFEAPISEKALEYVSLKYPELFVALIEQIMGNISRIESLAEDNEKN